jgi:hypothetical protein
MRRSERGNDAWIIVAVMLGLLGGPALAAIAILTVIKMADLGILPGEPVVAALVGLVPWVFVASALLTILIPQAPSWAFPAMLTFSFAMVGLVPLGVDGFRFGFSRNVSGFGTLVLLMSPCVGLTSYIGVRGARRFGPARCRLRYLKSAGDPRCPQCGYVLYHAEHLRCPECGRRFKISELDMRRALWDSYVLKPWEPGKAE